MKTCIRCGKEENEIKIKDTDNETYEIIVCGKCNGKKVI